MDTQSLLSSDNEIDKGGPTKLSYSYDRSCIDKFSFGWVFPVLKYGSTHKLTQDVLEDLSVEDQSQSVYYKWNDYWNEQQRINSKDPLYQSIKGAFKSKRNYMQEVT
jgi:hypothetical protein